MSENSFCSACGGRLSEEAKFCSHCGVSLTTKIERLPEIESYRRFSQKTKVIILCSFLMVLSCLIAVNVYVHSIGPRVADREKASIFNPCGKDQTIALQVQCQRETKPADANYVPKYNERTSTEAIDNADGVKRANQNLWNKEFEDYAQKVCENETGRDAQHCDTSGAMEHFDRVLHDAQ